MSNTPVSTVLNPVIDATYSTCTKSCSLTKNLEGAGEEAVDGTIASAVLTGDNAGRITINTGDKSLDGKTADFALTCVSMNAADPSTTSTEFTFSVEFVDDCYQALTDANLNAPTVDASNWLSEIFVEETQSLTFTKPTSSIAGCSITSYEDVSEFTQQAVNLPYGVTDSGGVKGDITLTDPAASDGMFSISTDQLANVG